MKPVKWVRVEAGWYVAERDGKGLGVGLTYERGAWWVHGPSEPHRFRFRRKTLNEAKRAARRVLSTRKGT